MDKVAVGSEVVGLLGVASSPREQDLAKGREDAPSDKNIAPQPAKYPTHRTKNASIGIFSSRLTANQPYIKTYIIKSPTLVSFPTETISNETHGHQPRNQELRTSNLIVSTIHQTEVERREDVPHQRS